jgi:hypothetical protein
LERGIKDLPVWKDHVRRFGLKAVRDRLRKNFLLRLFTGANAEN